MIRKANITCFLHQNTHITAKSLTMKFETEHSAIPVHLAVSKGHPWDNS
jgi:hypothetical protein